MNFLFHQLLFQCLGTIVRTITASDEDDPNREYGRIEYSLMPSGDSDSFLIDPSTGQITTAAILDREVKDTYKIQIEVKMFICLCFKAILNQSKPSA